MMGDVRLVHWLIGVRMDPPRFQIGCGGYIRASKDNGRTRFGDKAKSEVTCPKCLRYLAKREPEN